MHVERRREAAAPGEAFAGAQASAPDVSGQRTRNLQEWRKRRVAVAVEVKNECPGTTHGSADILRLPAEPLV